MPIDWNAYPKKYWHCYIKLTGSKAIHADGILNDLTFQQLRDLVVEPCRAGRAFQVESVIVKNLSQVAEIRIAQSPEPQRHYADQYNAEMGRKNVVDPMTNRWLIPFWKENSTDYTHELLSSESKSAATVTPAASERTPAKTFIAKAFIVHGHDTPALNEVGRFLERLDIEPVILMEREHKGRTLIEKLEQNADVQYAVILFTPDDEGRTAGEEALKPRARQNVALELGYFVGEIGRSRICVLKAADVEMPSDLHGVGYHTIDTEGAWKLSLALEMKAAGLPLDLNKLAS